MEQGSNHPALADLAQIEDGLLYGLAAEVVPTGGSGVENAQVSGLLAVVRATASHAVLRNMTQHQLTKARKEEERGAERAEFYRRLFEALQKVEQAAAELAARHPLPGAAPDGPAPFDKGGEKRRLAKRKEDWAGRLALTLMTHVAAEHAWRGSGR